MHFGFAPISSVVVSLGFVVRGLRTPTRLIHASRLHTGADAATNAIPATAIPLRTNRKMVASKGTIRTCDGTDTANDGHPENVADHRVAGGPHLSLLWSQHEPLKGQSLYLGGEVGCDGMIYCIPGHAPRVLMINTQTDTVHPIGPQLTSNGAKFKWLRGIPVGDVIYGLPCHASDILRIHVPTRTVTKLPIPYDEFYSDPEIAKQQREQIWKYHGGSVCPIDQCIYAIPQSAWHVVKIDPSTDTVSLVGPRLEGRYKWYGGVVGKADGAIYGIPQNASSVLRIAPSSITVHGDYGTGGHKWHGAAAAANGMIVGVPANADTVLCITPADPEPILVEIGDAATIQTGRHRSDGKYKYLGAIAGTNGKVYIFPSGSEHVLEVNTQTMRVRNVGPNLHSMERTVQNKWQNGLTCPQDQCVYAMPLAGETILRIDCSNSNGESRDEGDDESAEDPEPIVTTWKLPSPHRGLAKWEGGVLTKSGIMYTVPNNHKAVLRIEPACLRNSGKTKNNALTSATPETAEIGDVPKDDGTQAAARQADALRVATTVTKEAISPATAAPPPPPKPCASQPNQSQQQPQKRNNKKYVGKESEYGGDNENLKYRSGIPTLRSSAHRVKSSLKNRKHDPNPRDRHGKETKTTWLPPSVVIEDVFPYDIERYDLRRAIIQMLSQCDSNIIGEFQSDRLEDLQVPPSSVWRAVNGGRVEDAQKYLSNAVATNEQFLNAFDSFVQEVVLPYLKQRLVAAGAGDETEPITFYYQRPPTLRLQPGPGWAKVKPHRDSEYGHQNGELNFWVPLTDRSRTGVDLFCEKQNDFHPIPAKIGEGIAFHGSSVRHYVDANGTEQTRVSLDFRIGVQGYFDPYWQMKGTTDDHGRCEVQL